GSSALTPVGSLAEATYSSTPSKAGEAINPWTALPGTTKRDHTTAPVWASSTSNTPAFEPSATTSRPASVATSGVAPTSRSRPASSWKLEIHSSLPVAVSKAITPSTGLPTPTNPCPAGSTATDDHTPAPGSQSLRTQNDHSCLPVERSSAATRPGCSGESPYGDATPIRTRPPLIAGDDQIAGSSPGARQSQSRPPSATRSP